MSQSDNKEKTESMKFVGTIIRKFPILIRAQNKHGDLYFYAKSPEGVRKAALEIVKFRKEHCDCYLKNDTPSNFEEYFNRKHEFTLNHFKKMLNMMDKVAQNTKFNNTNIPMSEYIEYQKKQFNNDIMVNKVYYAATKAVKENDEIMASKVLNTTFEWEGENIIIETDIKEF